jgi:hypothetical protein
VLGRRGKRQEPKYYMPELSAEGCTMRLPGIIWISWEHFTA